jgi:glyceraldehyde 3-phosphate dehydrogenase
MRIAINGFGRIGRAVYRIAEEMDDIEIVVINDLFEPNALRYLLNYDTVMGRFEGDVRIEGDELVTPRNRARMISVKNLNWVSMRSWRRPVRFAAGSNWKCT